MVGTSIENLDVRTVGPFCGLQRRRQGVPQVRVARAIGARQSQVSGFERGRPVLAQDKIRKLIDFLEIDLTALASLDRPAATGLATAYCGSLDCPGALPFLIKGKPFMRPRIVKVPADKPGVCGLCGEVLVLACEQCQAPVYEGLVCPACGHPYLEPDDEVFAGDAESSRRRCDEVRREREMLLAAVFGSK